MVISGVNEFIVQAVILGVGATVVMDAWALFQRHVLGVPTLNYAMVGRWLGRMTYGEFAHASIADASDVKGETVLGWGAHYLIGILFAAILIAVVGEKWLSAPTLWPAVMAGVISVSAPFLIMQPAFGLGVAAAKMPSPLKARIRSVVTHAIYGLGLYLTALLMQYASDSF
ncbi:DUF2938 domain-containing protein [Photobacterium ganghwense]|uniref:DUF2938 domain-containing protein n=1 Tax=Photobacterium ganghwense TaxID=320778 RepID=UPI004056893C